MRTRRLMMVSAAVLGAGLPMVVGAGTGSAAQPAPTVVTHAVSAAESTVAYWTPERIANAKPLPAPEATAAPTDAAAPEAASIASIPPMVLGPTGTVAPTASPEAAALAVPRPYNKFPAKVNGLVVVTVDGIDYYCSGTALSSQNQSVVWTAGHCVFETGADVWYDNYAFVPGFGSSPTNLRPYGVWPARTAATTTQWVANDARFNLGAIIVNKVGGKTLGQAIGGMDGMKFNTVPGTKVHAAFGYPELAPFDPLKQYRCNSRVTRDTLFPAANRPLKMTCPMTRGADGGAWKVDIGASGLGFIVGVFSYQRSNSTAIWYATYHGSVAQTLALAAGQL